MGLEKCETELILGSSGLAATEATILAAEKIVYLTVPNVFFHVAEIVFPVR